MAQRKVVVAEYKCYSYFPVPNDVDLEDESVVEWWEVKWDILKIKYVDGRYVEIEKVHFEEDSMKHPEETTIESGEDLMWIGDLIEEQEKENHLKGKPDHKYCDKCDVFYCDDCVNKRLRLSEWFS